MDRLETLREMESLKKRIAELEREIYSLREKCGESKQSSEMTYVVKYTQFHEEGAGYTSREKWSFTADSISEAMIKLLTDRGWLFIYCRDDDWPCTNCTIDEGKKIQRCGGKCPAVGLEIYEDMKLDQVIKFVNIVGGKNVWNLIEPTSDFCSHLKKIQK